MCLTSANKQDNWVFVLDKFLAHLGSSQWRLNIIGVILRAELSVVFVNT